MFGQCQEISIGASRDFILEVQTLGFTTSVEKIEAYRELRAHVFQDG